MLKITYYLKAAFCAVVCTAGISFSLISSDIISEFLVKSLRLKTSPEFNGGPVAADFFDETEDDAGSGILNYPRYSQFVPGSLDLVRYTVHEPVYKAVWQQNPEYWQLDFEFKAGSQELRNVMVYICVDCIPGGETVPLFDNAENIEFDSLHPWNFAVWLSGESGTVYNEKHSAVCGTENYFKHGGKKIVVRIPLADKELRKIYASKTTWHYVAAGAFSKWDTGGFLPADRNEKIYDLLDGSLDSASRARQFSSRTFCPVEVKMQESSAQCDSDFESKVKEQFGKIQDQKIVPLLEEPASDSSFAQKLEYAVCVFEQGLHEKAEKILERLVKEDSGSALANAYYGSCLAIRGGKSNVFSAMKLVNQSFVYLDRAASLSEGTGEEIEVLLNRAGVASSVPETVFRKSAVAAWDYVRIAELCKGLYGEENSYERAVVSAYYYICAAENFRKAGLDEDAKMYAYYAEKIFQTQ
ncbi:glucodextranase DOMON-like domain-containing protein [Treponema sp.]|uniref:glucodextranase DOMON-like domain-containing protein n=1 Tax=Treponema sp. TaxID=166 RepID=UPI003F009E5A